MPQLLWDIIRATKTQLCYYNFAILISTENDLLGFQQTEYGSILIIGDLSHQLGGYMDNIFGNKIFVKGNLFLCYVLIFIFVGIYGLQWKYGYSLFIGIYMNTLMHVKH